MGEIKIKLVNPAINKIILTREEIVFVDAFSSCFINKFLQLKIAIDNRPFSTDFANPYEEIRLTFGKRNADKC